MKPKKNQIEKLHGIEALGNAPARSGEIRVERLEKRLKPKVAFPHRHDFFHILLVEKGSGWHEIEFCRYKVRPPQVFLVKPGEVHEWSLGASTRGYVLEFTRDSLPSRADTARLLSGLGELPGAFAPPAGIKETLALMFQEFAGGKAGFRLSLEYQLAALLVGLGRVPSPVTLSAPPSTLVEAFRELVEKNFRREHKIESYANMLQVSAKRLTSQVSRKLGKSAGQMVQERCLAEAKRLLAYSELSVAEVGYSLGYEDPNYFARFFRKHTGVAPGAFRKLANHTVHG